jgi:hypothetical protein
MQKLSNDIPELELSKLEATPELYRIYLEQAREDQFGFSFALDEALKNKKIAQLSDQKVCALIEKYVSELPAYFFYFDNEKLYRKDAAPTLYTNIISSSFDINGLLVLERFNSQIYDLRTFHGAFIDGPCHDLDLSINGRYMMRSAESRPGFHVYSLGEDGEYVDTDFYWDLDPFTNDFLNIHNRDQLELTLGKGMLKRIENFEPPRNREQVFEILRSKDINYVCSSLLRPFYCNDLEIAILGIQKEPLVYTLLCAELQNDSTIQKALFLDTDAHLTPYLLNYHLNLPAVLSEGQIVELLQVGRVNYHAFAFFGGTRRILLTAAKYDRLFFDFLEKYRSPYNNFDTEDKELDYWGARIQKDKKLHLEHHDLMSDRELMNVLSKQSNRIFRILDSSLLEDLDWVEEILVGNLHTLVYAPDSIKQNATLLMRVLENPETYKDFKLYHAHEDSTLQRFSELFLEPVFKLKLLKHFPRQPLNDDLPF